MNTLAYSMPDAAKQVGISRTQLYRCVKEGRGPRITRIGGRTLILCRDLEAWLLGLRAETAKAPARKGRVGGRKA